MGSRQATLLTPSESSGTARLLSHLESTLTEVLILKSFKFFRMNTYEKHRGEGLIVNQTSDEGCLSRATIGSEGSLLESDEGICPEEHRDEGSLYASDEDSCPACPELLGERVRRGGRVEGPLFPRGKFFQAGTPTRGTPLPPVTSLPRACRGGKGRESPAYPDFIGATDW